MSNRPRRFTVDEAPAPMMEEDDDDLFGELAGAGARDLESDFDGRESDGAGAVNSVAQGLCGSSCSSHCSFSLSLSLSLVFDM